MFFGISETEYQSYSPEVRIFLALAHGFHNGVPIVRASQQDKEYHFQNWVKRRIQATGLAYTEQGRNGYPDFVLNGHPIGFEVKGLSHPGRMADFDCNSQLPLAEHEGRKVFYIFGRYPLVKDNEFPVHDLVLCAASFLNAEVENTNTNQSFRGAGSYGDILIRDRRMYVCATPYALAAGTEGQATLILEKQPELLPPILKEVGQLQRMEAEDTVTGYAFDLRRNELRSEKDRNPNAGREHIFTAHKIKNQSDIPVSLNLRDR